MITKKELAGKIDHTLLGQEATLEKVKEVEIGRASCRERV